MGYVVSHILSNLWSINTGQSSTYVQFLHRQRSEHQLSSSWSTTLGHLGQRIEECILPPQTLQVWFYAESWKGCRYVEQLPSSAIKKWIFFFEVSFLRFFWSLPPPTGNPHFHEIVLEEVKSFYTLRNGGWPVFSISFNFTKTSSNFTKFRTSRPLWSEVQTLNFLKWSSWNSTDFMKPRFKSHQKVHELHESPTCSQNLCLLWINKARGKDKGYIWVSVRWKTTN
jgi:hypothetical protein